MSVSIVIPAKNEAAALPKLLQSIIALQPEAEVIVVDDGSTDSTAEVVAQSGARVISHPYSKGNGAAVKTGARAAKGDVIVFMDGDGQHRAEDIARLLEHIDAGYDLVVGARGHESQASWGRDLANGIYNWLASKVVGRKVEDLTSGFRAVRRQFFMRCLYLLPNGFSYPTTSTMAFFRSGWSVDYIPIVADKRIGKSHISPLKDGIRFFLIIFKVATLYSPLKVFFPVCGSLFSLAVIHYAYTYIVDGRFTNMSAMIFIASIIVFMIGLVSEQITMLLYKDVDE